MLLVDTSAWIEFLRATGSPIALRVRSLSSDLRYATTDLVLAELRVGARSEQEELRVRRIAETGRFYPIRPLFDYETAADIARACRRAGSPVAIADCLIAAVAINNDLELLAGDSDFTEIAQHTGLRVAEIA
jgi:hypothetical protein